MIGLAVLGAAAVASPFTERDALPALPLEQPVGVPRGWTMVAGAFVPALPAGTLDVRSGVAARLELGVVASLTTREGTPHVAAPLFTGRWTLGVREAPSGSLAAVAGATPPWEGRGPGATVGLEGRTTWAPVRFGGGLQAGVGAGPGSPTDRLVAQGLADVLLQLGPVAPYGSGSVRVSPGLVAPSVTVGGQLNASRGLAVWAHHRWPVTASGPPSRFELGLRVAF